MRRELQNPYVVALLKAGEKAMIFLAGILK